MNWTYYIPPILIVLIYYFSFIRKRNAVSIKPTSLPNYECEFLIRYYEHLSDDTFVYRLPLPIGVDRTKVKTLLYKLHIVHSSSVVYEVKSGLVTLSDSIMVFLPTSSVPQGIPFNAKCRVSITFVWEE